MESTGIVRKVDALGRIVLPKDTREAFHIQEKDALEILIDRENEEIVLKKVTRRCTRCRSNERLKEIKSGVYLCETCIQKLR